MLVNHPLDARPLLIALALVACACTMDPADNADTQPVDTTSTSALADTSTSTTTVPTTTTIASTTTTTAGDPVDSEVIHGTWRSPEGGFYLIFDESGSWQAAYVPDSDRPFDFGRYLFDGRELTLFSGSDVEGSPCAGLSGTYVTSFSNEGEQFSLPSSGAFDACRQRQGDMVRGGFVKQSP